MIMIVCMLIGAAYLAGTAALFLHVGPLLIASGKPELILLAYLLPLAWLAVTLPLYIVLMEACWPSAHGIEPYLEVRYPSARSAALA